MKHSETRIESGATVRKLLLCFGLLQVFALETKAQRIFEVNRPADADVIVFLSGSSEKADLLVYRVNFYHEAKENKGLWFKALHTKLADRKVYFTEWEKNAHVIIYYVSDMRTAGWQNPLKMYLFDVN